MAITFSSRDFRDALGLFATGIAVATTARGNEKSGITINSFASVSLDPPLVLFSASKNLRSYEAFDAAEGFAINVLSKEQKDISALFARPGADKWHGIEAKEGSHGGVLISPSLVSFDCKLHRKHDGGDHTIFVGEVTNVVVASANEPLIYFRSQYHELVSQSSMLAA